MRILMFPFCLVACQQVPPEGNPLEPVKVRAAAPVDEDAAEPAGAVSTPEDEEAVFTLSSEEMASALTDSPEIAAPSSESTPGDEPKGEGDAAGEGAGVSTAPVVDTPQPAARPGWPTQGATAWPVRLVTTVPNASPPRAILGLPDGREVVVNPGSMVPDLGIVVVAISPNSADLAKVAPAGDHATIESVTLTAQY